MLAKIKESKVFSIRCSQPKTTASRIYAQDLVPSIQNLNISVVNLNIVNFVSKVYETGHLISFCLIIMCEVL